MRTSNLLCALSGALLLLSCAGREVDTPEYEVVATWEGGDPITRSRLVPGEDVTQVVWTKNDAFTMVGYDNGFRVAYFATTNDGTSTATFTTSNSLEGYSPTYSLYPRSKVRYQYVGGEVCLIAPVYPTQKPKAGGVEEGVNIASAYSNYWLDNIYFMNVLTYVRFKLTGAAVADLVSVTFDAGKTVTGDMTIRWVDGEPVASLDRYWNPVMAERSTTVTLEGTFKEGKDYFMALMPADLDGFNFTFKDKDGRTMTKHSSRGLAMKRSNTYDFGTIDLGDQLVTVEDDVQVTKYMSQTKGNSPLDLCVISEGFTQAELSQFQNLAKGAVDFLFGTEPFKSYKDYFNVYFLSVASNASGASVTDGSGTIVTSKDTYFKARWGETKFSDMTADDEKVYTFVSKWCPEIASGDLKIQDVPILMLINDSRYAGITRSSEDGRGYSMVPYTRDENGNVKTLMWNYPQQVPKTDEPLANANAANTSWMMINNSIQQEIGGYSYGDWRYVAVHEFGGHCFARLGDEYWRTNNYADFAMVSHNWTVPFGLNISTDYANVAWKQALLDNQAKLKDQDPHYGRIGKYQGGDDYMFGRWRAERVSSMTDNRRYFSAWQRILIVKRILEKAGGTFSLDAFFAADVTTDPMRDQASSGTPDIDIENAEEVDALPSPVFTDGKQ